MNSLRLDNKELKKLYYNVINRHSYIKYKNTHNKAVTIWTINLVRYSFPLIKFKNQFTKRGTTLPPVALPPIHALLFKAYFEHRFGATVWTSETVHGFNTKFLAVTILTIQKFWTITFTIQAGLYINFSLLKKCKAKCEFLISAAVPLKLKVWEV